MTIKRNWRAARTVVCDWCYKRAPLWRALLPGSSWKLHPRSAREAAHSCPECCPTGSYRHMGGPQ